MIKYDVARWSKWSSDIWYSSPLLPVCKPVLWVFNRNTAELTVVSIVQQGNLLLKDSILYTLAYKRSTSGTFSCFNLREGLSPGLSGFMQNNPGTTMWFSTSEASQRVSSNSCVTAYFLCMPLRWDAATQESRCNVLWLLPLLPFEIAQGGKPNKRYVSSTDSQKYITRSMLLLKA